MINLVATTDTLDLVTGQACSLDVHASFVDYTTASGAINPDKQNTGITTAATTTILAAPSAGNVRNAVNINIRNKHATNSVDVTVRYNQNATIYELHKVTLKAGELLTYVEGIGWFTYTAPVLPRIGRVLTADDAGGQAVATAQPWFPTNGALTVPATTTFRITGLLMVTSGATTHTTGILFGGTATLTSIDYYAQNHRSAANTLSAVFSGIEANVATNIVTDVTGVQAAHYIMINGIIRINATGTLIPQFQFSANPTGTITVKRNTFFLLEYIGDNTVDKLGTWS